MNQDIAISTDFLWGVDQPTAMFEVLAKMFKEAKAYGIIHKAGSIQGPIELRPIKSSFLSNAVKEKSGISKWTPLLPNAAKSVHVSCGHKVLINISCGVSHGLGRCEDTKQITYLYDDSILFGDIKKSNLVTKAFLPMVKNFSIDRLRFCDELWVAHNQMKKRIEKLTNRIDIKVIPPFFDLGNYQLVEEAIKNGVVIESNSFDEKQLKKVVSLLEEEKIEFKVLLTDEKDYDFINAECKLKTTCSSKLQNIFSTSYAFIQSANEKFPKNALSARCSGVPTVLIDGQNPYLDEQFVNQLQDLKDLKSNLIDCHNLTNEQRKKIRGTAMKYFDLKFKSMLKRKVDELLQ